MRDRLFEISLSYKMGQIFNEIISISFELVVDMIKLLCLRFTQQRRLRKILSLQKMKSALIIPLREGKLQGYTAVQKFATSQEMSASLNIMKLVSKAGYPECSKYERLVFGNKSYAEMALKNKMAFNYFSIGGPYGNSFASYILRKYFPNFKMSCGREVYEHFALYEKPDCYLLYEENPYYIEYKDENAEMKYIHYNKSYQSNYIVLIKMTEKDFKCKKHGTIHLIWGGRADVTEAATNMFFEYEKEVYKRLKKHRQHYFIVCEYCKEFGVDFDRWFDLTDAMFSK